MITDVNVEKVAMIISERDHLLDRIKVLEGEVAVCDKSFHQQIQFKLEACKRVEELNSLLRRIPLGLLRVEEHKQLYLDLCAALNIEPWVEK